MRTNNLDVSISSTILTEWRDNGIPVWVEVDLSLLNSVESEMWGSHGGFPCLWNDTYIIRHIKMHGFKIVYENTVVYSSSTELDSIPNFWTLQKWTAREQWVFVCWFDWLVGWLGAWVFIFFYSLSAWFVLTYCHLKKFAYPGVLLKVNEVTFNLNLYFPQINFLNTIHSKFCFLKLWKRIPKTESHFSLTFLIGL